MKTHYRLIWAVALLFSISLINAFGQKGDVVEKEIRFARGKSSATVRGVVPSRLDSHIFYLTASEGQTMTVTMTSKKPLRDAHLVVNFPLTADGENETLSEKRKYTFVLPRSGKYEIYIEAIRDNIDYSITVTIK